MTSDQREHCLRAVIAYDEMHKPQSERVGYIDRGRKTARATGEQALRFAESEQKGDED